MKILHVILGKADKNRANGVNQVIAGLAKHASKQGVEVSVLGLAQSAEHEGEVLAREGFDVTVFTSWSRSFAKALEVMIAWADVVHLHGTYSPFNIRVARVCGRLGTPYVVTLHGGLSPGRVSRRNMLRKRLFHFLVQKRHLERAALIHALTEEESTEALSRVRPTAMTVIPNGVDLDDFPPPAPRTPPGPDLRIGYIGRISREKNLDALCEAFAAVNTQGTMRLQLAGPENAEAEQIARRWSSRGVELVGAKYGADKLTFLDGLDLFVHPSKADVFSIGAMEALACRLPMVITRTADASHFAEAGAFVLSEPTAFGLERALRKAIAQRDDWPEMAHRGRRLIETRLNWDAAATDLIAAYRNVLER